MIKTQDFKEVVHMAMDTIWTNKLRSGWTFHSCRGCSQAASVACGW